MNKILRYFLLFSVFFVYIAYAEEGKSIANSNEQELGKISITISPFEYRYDPNGTSRKGYTRNMLGPVKEYGIYIYPTNSKAKEMWIRKIEVLKEFPEGQTIGEGDPPKTNEEIIERLNSGLTANISVTPGIEYREITLDFNLPVGEYLLDYYVEFENETRLIPLRNAIYEPPSYFPLWGPLQIFISKEESFELKVKPTYQNRLEGRQDSLKFVMKYMKGICKEKLPLPSDEATMQNAQKFVQEHSDEYEICPNCNGTGIAQQRGTNFRDICGICEGKGYIHK